MPPTLLRMYIGMLCLQIIRYLNDPVYYRNGGYTCIDRAPFV